MGTFEALRGDIKDASFGFENRQHRVGIRRCPNISCRAIVYIVTDVHAVPSVIKDIYPRERLEFDPINIPTSLASHFEEAITCHAEGCFIAAAIMVRKTLEDLCHDKQATGANLKAKLSDLKTKIVVPQPLIEAADGLRLLGNDAAHLEAQVFDQIGREELEVAIELTKELLKATYQYDSLLARLNALKKSGG